MPFNKTLSEKAYITGEYYLVEIDTILEFYKKAGYDVENEEESVPNVLTIDNQECFFTGDIVKRGEKYFEIVIAAKEFSWAEVEHEEFDDELIEED